MDEFRSYHFFEYDDNEFAFRVYNDVVKVYPVKKNGILHQKVFIEIPKLDKLLLIQAAIQLLERDNKELRI